MYQLGFDFQAVPGFRLEQEQRLGTPLVAQNELLLLRRKVSQKYFVPSGRSSRYVITTSMWEKDVGPREIGLCV